MKKTIYAILFLLTFVTNISFINAGVFTSSYSNGELISTCRYYFKGTTSNIINYEDEYNSGMYTANQDSTIPYIANYFGKEKIATLRIYFHSETKNIKFEVTDNDGKVTSINYHNKGSQWTDANLLKCPSNLYQYVPKTDAETAFNLSDLYVETGSEITVQQQFYGKYFQIKYNFDGKLNSQNPEYEVYYSSLYSIARSGGISLNQYASQKVSCSYPLENGKKLEMTLEKDGTANVSYNGSSYTEGKYAFVKYVEENGKCPVTVCFDPGSNGVVGSATKLTLSNDKNKVCDSVGGTDTTNPTDDRAENENEKLATMTQEDYELAQAHLSDFKNAFSRYLDCVVGNDTNGKCNTEKMEYSKKCYANADPLTCNPSQKLLLTCIDKNYSKTEYNKGCESLKAEYEDAYAALLKFQEETGNVFITGMIKDIDQSLNLEELTCEELFGEDILAFIHAVFRIIQVGGVVLVIVLSMSDFMNAVAKGDDDAMKKASKNFKTRLIVIVLLLVLPQLIEFILEAFNDSLNLNNTNPLCK